MFGKLSVKRSPVYCGSRHLDVSAKGGGTVTPLPRGLWELANCFSCHSKIALLGFLRQGQQVDVMVKICEVAVRIRFNLAEWLRGVAQK